MSTGVEVDPDINESFMDFKIKKAQRFYVYKIVDKKIIKIDYAGPRDATYDDLLEKLPENEPRYVLIDLDFKSKDGRPTSKLVFISWNPDTGSIRSKMLYSASKESIKNALPGVGIHINATDRAELDLDESIIPVAQSFTR